MQTAKIKLRERRKTLKEDIEPKNNDVTRESIIVFKKHLRFSIKYIWQRGARGI